MKIRERTVRVNDDLMSRGESSNGGWSRKQLAIIGVPWPPRKGWKLSCLSYISAEDAELFVALRDRHLKSKATPLFG